MHKTKEDINLGFIRSCSVRQHHFALVLLWLCRFHNVGVYAVRHRANQHYEPQAFGLSAQLSLLARFIISEGEVLGMLSRFCFTEVAICLRIHLSDRLPNRLLPRVLPRHSSGLECTFEHAVGAPILFHFQFRW